MATLQELKQKIAVTEEQLLNLKAQYYSTCFSELGMNPKTKEDMLAVIITVEEVVEFGKHCVEQFNKDNP